MEANLSPKEIRGFTARRLRHELRLRELDKKDVAILRRLRSQLVDRLLAVNQTPLNPEPEASHEH